MGPRLEVPDPGHVLVGLRVDRALWLDALRRVRGLVDGAVVDSVAGDDAHAVAAVEPPADLHLALVDNVHGDRLQLSDNLSEKGYLDKHFVMHE